MNIKKFLVFSFVLASANTIASDSQEDTCSCWQLLTSCFIEKSDKSQHNFDSNQIDNGFDYCEFPGEIENQTIGDDNNFLIYNSNPSLHSSRAVSEIQLNQTTNKAEASTIQKTSDNKSFLLERPYRNIRQ